MPEEIKKPPLIQQLLPYLFAVGILVWIFTGLKTNAQNEPVTLSTDAWAGLPHESVIASTIVVYGEGRSIRYCAEDDDDAGCENAGDYRIQIDEATGGVQLQATPLGRLAKGGVVFVDYSRKISLKELSARLADVKLGLFLPLMLLNVLVFLLADALAFGHAYRRFNVPSITLKERILVRGAPYLVQIGLAPLAEALFPLYLYRVHHVKVSHGLSSNIWTAIIDLAAIATLLTPAVFYNVMIETIVKPIDAIWLFALALFWAAFFGNILFWRLKRRGSTKGDDNDNFGLSRTFRMAKLSDYAFVFGVRLVLWLTFAATNYAAILAVGLTPPLTLAMIAIPLVVMSIFLPIGVGGYGGPQLIAWFLFVKVGSLMPAEAVLLYSLLFSTLFLIGRALIGALLFPAFWRKVMEKGAASS